MVDTGRRSRGAIRVLHRGWMRASVAVLVGRGGGEWERVGVAGVGGINWLRPGMGCTAADDVRGGAVDLAGDILGAASFRRRAATDSRVESSRVRLSNERNELSESFGDNSACRAEKVRRGIRVMRKERAV